MSRTKHNAETVAEAIKKAGGIKAAAARALGVSRPTLDAYIERWVTVRDAYEEANETNLDIAEGKLLEQVRAGDPRQIQFYLRTKGRQRGYGDRMEVTGKDGAAVQIERVNAKPRDA